jgi:hypothetical protein
MTIDYVEEIIKLQRKIKNGEVNIGDIITDEIMKEMRIHGQTAKLIEYGHENELYKRLDDEKEWKLIREINVQLGKENGKS